MIQVDPEWTLQEYRPKQLQTYNLPTDDVENVDSTNKGRDLLLANQPQIVPRGTEMMPQRIQRHKGVTYRDQCIINESKTRRKNLAMAWINNKKQMI